MPNRWNPTHLLLAAAILITACSSSTTVETKGDESKSDKKQAAKSNTVKMMIDYADGVEKHFVRLPWKAGLTIGGAMEAAAKHPRGIRYETKGDGDTTFLLSIDGLKNEGGDGEARNWLFSVNEKPGMTSFAIHELKAGDMIKWSFKEYKSDEM